MFQKLPYYAVKNVGGNLKKIQNPPKTPQFSFIDMKSAVFFVYLKLYFRQQVAEKFFAGRGGEKLGLIS